MAGNQPACAPETEGVEPNQSDAPLTSQYAGGLAKHLVRIRGKVGRMMKDHKIHGITGKRQLVGVTNRHALRHMGMPGRAGNNLLGKIGTTRQRQSVTQANLKLSCPGKALQFLIKYCSLAGQQGAAKGGLHPTFKTLMSC